MPIFVLIFVWLIILSTLSFWILRFFKKVTKDVDKKNLIKALEELINKQELGQESIKNLKDELKGFEQESKLHLQKYGLVRFNPFKELGGEHSFSMALLNGKDTGILITGLHTRERTRVYVKDIKNGKSSLELSSEEKKALKIATKGKEI